MTASLALTAAGIAAIADGANVGLAAVTFTRLALGSGTGMGDQSARTALETQKDIVAVTGSASTPGRIAIRGDYAPTETYAVTEVGLFAKVGAQGAEFLCAYWIAESDEDAVAAAAAGTALVIAGIVEVVAAAADINIAPAVNIQIGAPANAVYLDRHATVDQRGIIELATLLEGRNGTDDERAITALVLAGILADYGTRTWVSAEIAKIVGSAPESLNTLQEIAAWLGSDANLSTAINNAIAGRVRRTGDTMTGALNLVTPGANDNSKKAVNSEWVKDFSDGRYMSRTARALSIRGRNAAQTHGDIDALLSDAEDGVFPCFGLWQVNGTTGGAARQYGHIVSHIEKSGASYLLFGTLVAINTSTNINPNGGHFARLTIAADALTYETVRLSVSNDYAARSLTATSVDIKAQLLG